MPDSIVQEALDNYKYDSENWRPIRDEGRTDMRFLLGDPWDAGDRRAREEFDRPCINFDELNQYVNQLLNTVRQNKRSIKVTPRGAGSNDKTAELRESRIRYIETESNAQSAYISGFEGAVQRSYGVLCRINTAYESDESFDQKLVIRRVPNPDTVLFDWDSKEIDCSDADHLLELDYIPRSAFARKFPNATKRSFTADDMKAAPNWIRDRDILVAGYWKVKKAPSTLYLVETSQVKGESRPVVFSEEELREISRPGPVLKKRDVQKRSVCQYVTNGIELLETNEWAGKWIPFVPCFGRELYIDDGNGAKRKLLSLVRLARDPQMAYAWIRSNMAEAVGQSPKSIYLGYEGQFETSTDWENIARSPMVYATVKPMSDPVNPQQVLPLPRREQYEPPLQALELFAEASRRAIQAAMGITPLPTAAQRNNEKSGVALKRINEQESIGTFHFIDSYDFALRHAGLIVNDLLDKIEDTPRDVGIIKRDEKSAVVRLHDPEWVNPDTKEEEEVHYGGLHDVTVSAGPSYQSEREEADDFADKILENVEALPLDPATKGRFLALVIKMRDLGVYGDEMAKILAPDQGDPQQALLQAQQNAAITQKIVAELQAENQKLKLEKAGKVIDNEYAMQMQRLQNDIKVLIAEIQAKSQDQAQRLEMFMTFWKENHGAAHDAALSAMEHEQSQDLATHTAALNPQPQPEAQPQQ